MDLLDLFFVVHFTWKETKNGLLSMYSENYIIFYNGAIPSYCKKLFGYNMLSAGIYA